MRTTAPMIPRRGDSRRLIREVGARVEKTKNQNRYRLEDRFHLDVKIRRWFPGPAVKRQRQLGNRSEDLCLVVL